jgi:LacI family transcriptional regulator
LKRKISIHDIAKALQVSATTVSFVLNGKAEEKRISSEVQKKILKHVEKVGYQPNMVAKSLRTGKSKIIGMMVEDIADPFFSSIARIIEENTYKLGYKIFHSSTDNDTHKAKALIKVFRERQVDGYIIAPTPGIEKDIQALLDDGLPVVLFDRYFPALNTHNVVIDNFGGAYNAVQHLVENGYAHIGLVTLDSEQVQMLDRLKGFTRAVNDKEVGKYVLKVPYKMEPDKIAEKVKLFLQKNNVLDAVLFATNYLAISGLKAIRELELQIPDRIGVVGFDDNTHFSLFSPSITAIAQPVQEISREVIQQMIKAITTGEKTLKKKTTVLPTKLIVRDSSLTHFVAKQLKYR